MLGGANESKRSSPCDESAPCRACGSSGEKSWRKVCGSDGGRGCVAVDLSRNSGTRGGCRGCEGPAAADGSSDGRVGQASTGRPRPAGIGSPCDNDGGSGDREGDSGKDGASDRYATSAVRAGAVAAGTPPVLGGINRFNHGAVDSGAPPASARPSSSDAQCTVAPAPWSGGEGKGPPAT